MPEKFSFNPLEKIYPDLHKSEKAEHAAVRRGKREGRFIMKPAEKIGAYLSDLEQIHLGKIDPKTGEIAPNDPAKVERIKDVYHRNLIIKPEAVSDEYIKGVLLGNFAEQKGYSRDKLTDPKIKQYIIDLFQKETRQNIEEYQIPRDQRVEVVDAVVTDQESSFDAWYDYLTSPEASNSPTAFRYWAFESLKKLGSYNKDRGDFTSRRADTVASFPELNQQALALVLDEVGRKYSGEPSRLRIDDETKQKEFEKRLKHENFGKLYGWAVEHVNSLRFPEERLIITKGEWKLFPRGSDPKALTDSLASFNTAWCIAGVGYASNYLSRSDISIYFSEDSEGKNSIPRAAIVDDGSSISEVRGIAQKGLAKQHLDDYIAPVVAEKLNEMPGGSGWQEGVNDMKKLAELHFKHLQSQNFTKDDLRFLYELDRPIKNLGYQNDPRIDDLLAGRNSEQDMPIIFDCAESQIARNPEEINEDTIAYVGSLTTGIFKKLPETVEDIYTKFPENRIHRENLEIGGKTKEQLENEIRKAGMQISSYAESMMDSLEFTTLKTKENLKLIRLSVADLGFPQGATTDEIYSKAKELGLELCPAETGPNYRLKYTNQPNGEYELIAMKQIADGGGHPSVFNVYRNEDALWLGIGFVKPTGRWNSVFRFVFSFRKY